MAARKAAKAAKKAPRKVTPPPAVVEQPAAPPPSPPPGPTLVTITANAPVRVISERLGDRERHENGVQPMVAGESIPFIVHAGQSLRIVEGH